MDRVVSTNVVKIWVNELLVVEMVDGIVVVGIPKEGNNDDLL